MYINELITSKKKLLLNYHGIETLALGVCSSERKTGQRQLDKARWELKKLQKPLHFRRTHVLVVAGPTVPRTKVAK